MLLEGKIGTQYPILYHVLYVLKKKRTCFPIGKVHDRRGERNNALIAMYIQAEFHCSFHQFHIRNEFIQIST